MPDRSDGAGPAIFDRLIALAQLLCIVIGGIWAAVEWYTFRHDYDTYTLDEAKERAGERKQKPYDYEGTLTVTELKRFDDGTRLYDVSYDVETKNLSKAELAFSYSFAEVYVGDVPSEELAPGTAVLINDTPDPWHSGAEGYIRWRKLAYEADLLDGDKDAKVVEFLHKNFDIVGHGGLTDYYPEGTTGAYEPEFLVRAKPTQYVGMVVGFGVNNVIDVDSPDVGLLLEVQAFADAERANAGAGERRPREAQKKKTDHETHRSPTGK